MIQRMTDTKSPLYPLQGHPCFAPHMEDSSDSDESVILRAKQRQLRKKEMGARLATSSDAEAIHTHIAGTFFPVVSARLSQLQSQFRRHLDAKRDEHSDSDPESDQDKSGPMVRAAGSFSC